MLRIYAGNADLKATFKTVAIKKGMLVKNVVEEAVKKFRILNANADEYYIGVLFMDSRTCCKSMSAFNFLPVGCCHTHIHVCS